jgi:TolB-like protein
MNKVAPNTASHTAGTSAFGPEGPPVSLVLPRPELVQKHLDKVLASAEMCRSKKLCQFLRFTVGEVLQGHGSELKEYAIAVGVFRRGREFDPGADPIVRVQARRLRSKLEHYYETEGREEPIRIEYPVGSYSPIFTRRIAPFDLPRPAVSSPAPAVKQIAVLPFLNVGPDDFHCFSDGLTEDLIHYLSGYPGLGVVARSSCFEFKGLSVDVRRIGERLGVSALVSGSVRLEGVRLRVLVQLIDTGTGVNLWSGVYDRELEGVLATQESISREIASSLQSLLIPAPRALTAAGA